MNGSEDFGLPEAANCLADDKNQTRRKDGTRRLQQVLDSSNALAVLDNTFLAPGEHYVLVKTPRGDLWCGLCKALLSCLDADVLRATKKKLDVQTVRTFKKFVQTACEPRRAAAAPLRRNARKLFEHVAAVLSLPGCVAPAAAAAPAASGWQAVAVEYGLVLRELCGHPAYAALCQGSDYAALLDALMKVLEVSLEGGRSPHLTRDLQKLEMVLRAVPRSLCPDFSTATLEFVAKLFHGVAGRHEERAMAAAALGVAGAVFLRHGASSSTEALAAAFEAAWPFLRLFWADNVRRGDPQASVGGCEACLLLTLLALRLDAVRTSDSLGGVWSLACQEVRQTRWPPPPAWPCGDGASPAAAAAAPMALREALLVRLLAAAVHRRVDKGSDLAPAPLPAQPPLRESAAAPPPARDTAGSASDPFGGAADPLGLGDEALNALVDVLSLPGEGGAPPGARRQRDGSQGGERPRQRRRVLSAVEQLCEAVRQDAQGWACVVACFVWSYPCALDVPDACALVCALCSAASSLLDEPEVAATRSKDAAGGRLDTVAWVLLALDGVAATAQGVPPHARTAQQRRTDERRATLLAASAPWRLVHALAERCVAAAAAAPRQSRPTLICAAAAMRCLRTLMVRGLCLVAVEDNATWRGVEALLARASGVAAAADDGAAAEGGGATPRESDGSGGPETAAAMHEGPAVKLNNSYGLAATVNGMSGATGGALDDGPVCACAVQEALLLQGRRFSEWRLTGRCPRGSTASALAQCLAASEPRAATLVRVRSVLAVLGLPAPGWLLRDAPLCQDPASVRCVSGHGQYWRGGGGVGDDWIGSGGDAWREVLWGCDHELMEMLASHVPCASTVRDRFTAGAAAAQSAHAEAPPPPTVTLEHVARNAAAFAALHDLLVTQLTDTAPPDVPQQPHTHRRMLGLLEPCAVALCVMATLSQLHGSLRGPGSAVYGDSEALFGQASRLRALTHAALASAAPLLATAVEREVQPPPPPAADAARTRPPPSQRPASQFGARTSQSGSAAAASAAAAAAAADADAPPALTPVVLQLVQTIACALRVLEGGAAASPLNAVASNCGAAIIALYRATLAPGASSRASNMASNDAFDDFADSRAARQVATSAAAPQPVADPDGVHTRLVTLLHAVAFACPDESAQAFEEVLDELESPDVVGDGGVGPLWMQQLSRAVCSVAILGGDGSPAWPLLVDLIVGEHAYVLHHHGLNSFGALHTMLAISTAILHALALGVVSEAAGDGQATLALQRGAAPICSGAACHLLQQNARDIMAASGRPKEGPPDAIAPMAEIMDGTDWPLRVHLLAALEAGVRGGHQAFLTDHTLEICLFFLNDHVAAVRLAAASLAPQFARHSRLGARWVWQALCSHAELPGLCAAAGKAKLKLSKEAGIARQVSESLRSDPHSDHPPSGLDLRQQCAVAALVRMAARRPEFEPAVVCCLLDFAARAPEQADVVAAALDWLAVSAGYLRWPHFLLASSAPIFAAWASLGGSFEALLSASKLLALPRPSRARDPEDSCVKGAPAGCEVAAPWRSVGAAPEASDSVWDARLAVPWVDAPAVAATLQGPDWLRVTALLPLLPAIVPAYWLRKHAADAAGDTVAAREQAADELDAVADKCGWDADEMRTRLAAPILASALAVTGTLNHAAARGVGSKAVEELSERSWLSLSVLACAFASALPPPPRTRGGDPGGAQEAPAGVDRENIRPADVAAALRPIWQSHAPPPPEAPRRQRRSSGEVARAPDLRAARAQVMVLGARRHISRQRGARHTLRALGALEAAALASDADGCGDAAVLLLGRMQGLLECMRSAADAPLSGASVRLQLAAAAQLASVVRAVEAPCLALALQPLTLQLALLTDAAAGRFQQALMALDVLAWESVHAAAPPRGAAPPSAAALWRDLWDGAPAAVLLDDPPAEGGGGGGLCEGVELLEDRCEATAAAAAARALLASLVGASSAVYAAAPPSVHPEVFEHVLPLPPVPPFAALSAAVVSAIETARRQALQGLAWTAALPAVALALPTLPRRFRRVACAAVAAMPPPPGAADGDTTALVVRALGLASAPREGAADPEVAALFAALLKRSRPVSTRDLAERSGHCVLPCSGASRQHLLRLQARLDRVDGKTQQLDDDRAAPSSVQDHFALAQAGVLCHLASWVSGPCPDLAALGQQCAMLALSTDGDWGALQALQQAEAAAAADLALPAALTPLLGEIRRFDGAGCAADGADDGGAGAVDWSARLLGDPELTSPATEPGRWAVALAAALLSHPACAASECSAYRAAAAHSAALSAQVVPLALLQLAASAAACDGDGPESTQSQDAATDACDALSRLFAMQLPPLDGVLRSLSYTASGAGEAPEASATVELILRCVAFLRSAYLSAKHQGAARGKKAPSPADEACRNWDSECWLRLDLLQVAGAAIACGLDMEAMWYVEAWCEGITRRARLPTAAEVAAAAGGHSAPLASLAGLLPAEALLLAAHRRVSDPDALYGVARGPHEEFQVALAEHEHRWDEALLWHSQRLDDALSAPGGESQGRSSGPGADSERRGGRCRAREAISTCLRRLGCDGLAESLPHAPGRRSTDGYARGAGGLAAAAGLGGAAEAAAASLGAWDPALGGDDLAARADALLHASMASASEGLLGSAGEALRSAEAAAIGAVARRQLHGCDAVDGAFVRLHISSLLRGTLSAAAQVGSADPGVPVTQLTASHGAASHALRNLSAGVVQERLSAFGDAVDRLRPAVGDAALLPILRARVDHAAALSAPPAHHCAALCGLAAGLRKAGRFQESQAAFAALLRLWRADGRGGAGPPWWRVEEAKLAWARGRSQLAIALLDGLLAALPDVSQAPEEGHARSVRMAEWAPSEQRLYFAGVVALRSKWKSACRCDDAAVVLADLSHADAIACALENAVDSLPPSAPRLLGRVHYRLTCFVDRQYKLAQQRLAAPEFDDMLKLRDGHIKQKADLEAVASERESRRATLRVDAVDARGHKILGADGRPMKVLAGEDRTRSIAIKHATKSLRFCEAEIAALEANSDKYLQLTLDGISCTLLRCGTYDTQLAIRLVQLWLSPARPKATEGQVRAIFEAVASHKLVELAHQLASRMSGEATPFQSTLRAALTRLARDHPHHVLVLLFGLVGPPRAPPEGYTDKQAAARAMLSELSGVAALAPIIQELETIVAAYTELALAPAGSPMEGAKPLDAYSKKMSKRQFPRAGHVTVLSVQLPVDPSASYPVDELPRVDSFEPHVVLAGGLSMPKIITLRDTFGQKHRQLVKGRDDLRQDAVMQHFFRVLNHLLQSAASTRARALRMATYKVVTFGPEAGLLQFVENTESLGSYLYMGGGAHARYQLPGEWTHAQISTHVDKARKRGPLSLAQEAALFAEVCGRMRPVFHRFFSERYRSGALWHQKRCAYARSLAVGSMAGYVIGLGDRHCNNILIDSATAELVHIDLGIAFEGGRYLPSPELVPFRLTRDLVDALGVAGVDGVMRRCCEETLRVMRSSQDVLLTIIEVLIHDPLYVWALTSSKAAKVERRGEVDGSDGDAVDEVVNADAERAVMRVRLKLLGMEGDDGEARSVEGQVDQLLLAAQDPNNLCRHFHGWAPWI